jgi:hypothetical protein
MRVGGMNPANNKKAQHYITCNMHLLTSDSSHAYKTKKECLSKIFRQNAQEVIKNQN